MRALLSTIGSRGDVQPLLALAVELRSKGHECRLCAPPDFRDFVEAYAVPFVALGPAVRRVGSAAQVNSARLSPESIRLLMSETIAGQFATLGEAAASCDVIVA